MFECLKKELILFVESSKTAAMIGSFLLLHLILVLN